MIDKKLEDAIAIGPHLIHMHQAGSNERSSGKGNQGDGANSPSFRFPAFKFPAVECHGSFLSITAKLNLCPTSSCFPKDNHRVHAGCASQGSKVPKCQTCPSGSLQENALPPWSFSSRSITILAPAILALA